MTAIALFAATFAVVFALGIQQLNVTADLYVAAFITSALISSANLVLFKLLPGPTTALDFLGYTMGGCFGIVASMRAHPWLARTLAGLRWLRQQQQRLPHQPLQPPQPPAA